MTPEPPGDDAQRLPRAARMRIAELVTSHRLPEPASARLALLLLLLAEDPAAATAVRDPARAVDAHLADSLSALELAPVTSARRVADLGSGAGLPGLPLAIALPAATVSLVESAGRKSAFLDRAARELGVTNVRVRAERAETWREGLGRCDLVTARALAPLAVLVEYGAPLLAPGGHLVAWKGRLDPGEIRDGEAAAAATGLAPAGVHAVTPFAGADQHHLHLYLKVGSTPNRFPRRPGMARKRPLRAST